LALEPPPRKISKAAADYGEGLPQAHCGICQHFTSPNKCSVVIGPVAPEDWCKYFARMKHRKFGSLKTE
jgi:hypothetical protein